MAGGLPGAFIYLYRQMEPTLRQGVPEGGHKCKRSYPAFIPRRAQVLGGGLGAVDTVGSSIVLEGRKASWGKYTN
jgi:hypothetical protein